MVRIQRVRLADDTPLSFDETYLPRAIGEKIMEDDLETEPIFSLLEQKYNKPLVEAEYRLEAVAADAMIARELGIRRQQSHIPALRGPPTARGMNRSTTKSFITTATRFSL